MTAPALDRLIFKTSRLAEFCSQKELVNQTGHAIADWPLVIAKELIDNALDSAEEAGIAPTIEIIVTQDGITVSDNGSGIAPETITHILDYNARVSSREAYVSPTRGAQGNALKTILAMPYALSGERGETIIESRGVAHHIDFTTDRVRQTPLIDMTREPSPVQIGTRVTVRWPNSACSILHDAGPRLVPLAGKYTWANPHLMLSIKWGVPDTEVIELNIPATNSDWAKWRPSDPTSPHWYDLQRFSRLIAANIVHAQDHGRPCKTVRDFVAEFRGLKRTQARASVCDAVSASRLALDQFYGDGDDRDRVASLLDAMQWHSSPINPRLLGVIGRDHLAAKFEAVGADSESFEYRLAAFDHNGIPYLVEAAFGYCPDWSPTRRIITGINWSVTINDPLRKLGQFDQSLGEILTDLRAGQNEPIILALHIACPKIEYLDRGKSNISLPYRVAETVIKLVTDTTKRWTKQRKAEERDTSARLRRYDQMIKRRKMTQKEAASQVLHDAYMKASAGNTLPANVRQIYYAARPEILRLTERENLDYDYFSQTLLIDYMQENEDCAGWDVVYDDRGHFEEPHTGKLIGLGTLNVRDYLAGNGDLALEPPGFSDVDVTTNGPHGRFGAIMFVEKEGFDPLFKATKLAEKFDIAIMSSKGVSVTAARQLADRLCGDHGIPLLTLHAWSYSGIRVFQTNCQ
jgi:DNA topoisomerase VI subunit B